jgi:hypothetical protein
MGDDAVRAAPAPVRRDHVDLFPALLPEAPKSRRGTMSEDCIWSASENRSEKDRLFVETQVADGEYAPVKPVQASGTNPSGDRSSIHAELFELAQGN